MKASQWEKENAIRIAAIHARNDYQRQVYERVME
jgi:hypothetical protein